MKEFLLVFRRDDRTEELQPTTELIIKAVDYDHAVAIAHQAPVLELGGTVEVRMSV